VFATMVDTLADAEVIAQLKNRLQHVGSDYCLAFTQNNELLIARYLGHSAIQARTLLSSGWQLVRPAITGSAACEPRIWHT
jgi:urease accessory protein